MSQRPPDERAQPALRQTLGERINRRQAVEVDEVLFAVFDDFGFRMVHRARLEINRLAEHDHFVAHRKILLHERQVPPAAMEPRGPVVEDQLKDGLGVLLEPLHAEGDDRAPRRRRLAELQLGNRQELAAVLVAPWPMQQQVFDGADLQPGQLRRAFRADAVQGRHRSGQGRGLLIGRRSGHPPAPYNAKAEI